LSITRVLRNVALASTLVVPVVAASAPAEAATLRPATCTPNWTIEGVGQEVYGHDEYGRQLSVGEVFQQYDYCQHVRGVFEWESSFRTQSHYGIAGAYADVSIGSSNASGSSGTVGSGAGGVVLTPNLAVDSLEWTSSVKVTLDYTTGVNASCTAVAATWDYHDGGQVGAGHTCSMVFQ